MQFHFSLGVIKISGGEFKGQMIKSPPGADTRPTSAYLRESIFNVIVNGLGIQPRRVLDLFAGTGALGLEALSHGAESAIFVESSPKALKVLSQNIEKIARNKNTTLISEANPLKWPKLLQSHSSFLPFDLAFCDPPYKKGWILKALEALDHDFLWSEDAILVAEMAQGEAISHDKWQEIKEKAHADSRVVFLRRLK
jgi:16S rRNA (guanine966-N2)-methyltransferase